MAAGAGTTIDYFVVSNVIADYDVLSCDVIDPTVGNRRFVQKHNPVRLSITGADKSRMVTVAPSPPPIPGRPAVACRFTAVHG